MERLEERALLVAPSLVAVQPNAGTFFDLEIQQQLDVAPEQLTLQFNPGQVMDPQSALDGGIEIIGSGYDGTFGDGNEITITPGYIGVGETSEDLVIRFSHTLADDEYQINLLGTGANPLTNIGGEPLNDGAGDTTVNFSLDLGAKIVSVVPQPISGNGAAISQAMDQIVLYFNDDELDPVTAEDSRFYKLITTGNSVTSDDDVEIPPDRAVYDPDANTVTLTFPGDLHALADGAFRLRVGTDESLPAIPTVSTVTVDPGSSFRDANTDVGDISAGGNATFVLSQNIDAQNYDIEFPGANDDPGNRIVEPESHLNGGPDQDSGASIIAYNFKPNYGFDPNGSPLTNLITEEQKDRAREVFEYYSTVTGLDFVETADLGLTIVTGDLRALDPSIPPGTGGAIGLAGVEPNTMVPTAIMDSAENWVNEPRGGDADPGGTPPTENWFETAMHEIGHLLGLGHTYELPEMTIQGAEGAAGNGLGESSYPGQHDLTHLQHLFRPDSIDVDLYEFDVSNAGTFSAEIIAERDVNSSTLDSYLRLYQELEDGSLKVVAQNDDYFSSDSFVELSLEPGKYFVGVSSTGNDDYDPTIANTGMYGTSNGAYQLRLNFRAAVNDAITDLDEDHEGNPTPSAFDGDSDGIAGGVYNFWFNAAAPADTLIVDKTATPGVTADGSPLYDNVGAALTDATYGQIVRIIGNGGTDDDIATPEDTFSYEFGVDADNSPLEDGRDFNVPSGVTVMIDHAAVLKFRRAHIGVGSSLATIDRSAASLQVLGTPLSDVYFTSWNNEGLGQDTTGSLTFPLAGDWGGLSFRNDVDRRSTNFNYQREGIFLNYVNHANITYGGGRVLVDSALQTVSALQLTEAQPSMSWNTVTLNADSAISADPNSFEEIRFTTPEYLRGDSFTLDYDRVGPAIHDNTLVDNSVNGLFIRVLTPAGTERVELTVPARFDDTDVTHVMQETVQVSGTPGGGFFATEAPATDLTFVTAGPSGTLNTAGQYNYILVYITASGFEGPASDVTNTVTPTNGGLQLNNLPNASGIFTQRRLYRSDDTGAGDYTLIAQLDADGPTYVDDGTTLVGTLNPLNQVLLARLDARLSIDAGTVVKSLGASVEVEDGAQFIAEGFDGQEIIFTSLLDDRYGNSGTFDTNNDDDSATQGAGDWGGIYASGNTHISLDHSLVAHGGGVIPADGDFVAFNAIEIHQAASSRITNSLFESNAGGLGGVGGMRFGRGRNQPSPGATGAWNGATVFVRNSSTIFVGNVIRDNESAPLSFNVNAMVDDFVRDTGRSTGPANIIDRYQDNAGPLIRENLMDRNTVNGLELRAETLVTEVVLDDADIVSVVRDEIFIPDFHHFGGMRLQSTADSSLVLKFAGTTAGITANGRPLDIVDRIGGMLHVVGQPGNPVIMTSLADDDFGAGFGLDGLPLTDTNNDGDSDGAPGQWRGLLIDEFAHDRNVGIVVENETNIEAGAETNNDTLTAENVGTIGDTEKDADENLRMGVEVHGHIKQPGDIDVYTFAATAGVEVWVDVDMTRHSLDTVIELLDPDGEITTLSNNSIDEQNGTSNIFSVGAVANPLDRSVNISKDRYTTNQRDAGFRVVLPGQPGVQQQYFIRVRSSNVDVLDPAANPADLLDNSKLNDGLTSGSYQFQIRINEIDEQAGSTVRYADIRYATNGIEIKGQPTHSPLAGEFAELADIGNSPNSVDLGNLLSTDRAVLAVAATIGQETDVDVFTFDAVYDSTQQIEGVTPTDLHVPLVIDLDYADGFARANTVLSLFNENNQLVWMGRDSSIADDRTAPLDETPVSDLSRGSVGSLDPYIGPIEVPVGTYHLVVSSNAMLPEALDQFYTANPADPTIRLEPINTLDRIAEEHFGVFDGDTTTAADPITDLFDVTGVDDPVLANHHIVPWHLGDVALYVSTRTDAAAGEHGVQIVNPFTGTNRAQLTSSIAANGTTYQIGDIAMRGDGELFTMSSDETAAARTDDNTGLYLNIDVSTGAVSQQGDDGQTTFTCRLDNQGNIVVDDSNSGIGYDAFTYLGVGNADGLAVGHRGTGPLAPGPGDVRNILYNFDIRTGQGNHIGATRTDNGRCGGAATLITELGILNVQGDVTGMATLPNGQIWAVTDLGFLYRITAGANVVTGPISIPGGADFQGLAVGPDDVENGAYADTLFGITGNGTVIAFDTAGNLLPVFVDGQTSINTGMAGVTGLDFSTLDRNLWNASVHHGGDNRSGAQSDLGHGIYGNSPAGIANGDPGVPDYSRRDANGGTSIYFGNETDGQAAGNRNNLSDALQRNVNFPGGAHGAVISNEFSLSGYDATDKPVLYFNYYLDTDNTDYSPTRQMTDSFRVYVGSDSTHAPDPDPLIGLPVGGQTSWSLVTTNNNYQNATPFQTAGAAGFDEFDIGPTLNRTLYPANQTHPDVQPLFAETGTHTWRQARIDLSNFAGQDNLRLRFEFATGGGVGVGEINGNGEELRTLPGSELHDGETFSVDGVTFEFEMGFSIIAPSGGAATDEETFTINGTVFEFDTDGSAVAGIPIAITPTMTANEVAQAISGVLNANGIATALDDNRVNLTNALTLTQTNGTSATVEGAVGAAGVPLVINVESTREEVALVIQQALADTFAGGVTDAVKTSEDLVRIIGHRVTDSGPLPHTSNLPGDGFGNINSLLGSQNNDVEGVYVDDIIIGFAERGEMVVNAQGNINFAQNQELAQAWETQAQEILVGQYDVEIRRATDFGHGISQGEYPHQLLTLNPLICPWCAIYDTNDRFVEQTTLTVPDAANIADGQTFTLSDGDTVLTFEFEDAQALNGVAPGNIRILFDSMAAETGGVGAASAASVAQALRDAINSPAAQSMFDLQATLSDGVATGSASTAEQVVVIGVSVFDPGSSGVTAEIYTEHGDSNARREQGQIIIESTFVTDSSEWGINVGPGDTTPDNAVLAGDLPHAGPVRNLQNINTAREVPGVVLRNNVVALNSVGGIRFAGEDSLAAPAPYGRIINNTVVGDGSQIGISVEGSATPTLMNNIVSNHTVGIRVFGGSNIPNASPIIGTTAYHSNTTDSNFGVGSFPTFIADGDPLFVDPANRNYYLAPNSEAIDASQDAAADRPSIINVKSPLGISPSPILSPDLDVFGQLRADDPTVSPPAGLGANVFKDRGAIDRVDIDGPRGILAVPEDEGLEDLYPGFFHIVWRDDPTSLRELIVELTDEGIGVDDRTIQSGQFELYQDGELLVEGTDYQFVYNSTTDEVIFRSFTEFKNDSRYTIFVDNDDSVDDGLNGVRDYAGNFIQPNRPDGTTRFDILLTDGENDPPENLIPETADDMRLEVDEDTPLVFQDPITVQVTDPDAHIGDINSPPDPVSAPQGQLTITLTVTNGFVNLGDPSAVPVVTGDGTALVELTGNLDELNAALLNMTFQGDTDYFGPAEIEMHTDDLGNFSRLPIDPKTDTDIIYIDVLPINDEPTFEVSPDPHVYEDEGLDLDEGPNQDGDAGLVTIPGFITDIFAGVNEPDTLTAHALVLTTTGTLVFDVEPAIDPITGDLTFDSAIHTNGTATIEVWFTDDGVDAPPPNDNESEHKTFTLFVDAVNDRPLFDLPSQATASDEDDGPQVVEDFATQIAPAPAEATDESGDDGVSTPQDLMFVLEILSTTSTLAFVTPPAIDPVTGDLTYEAAPDTAGTAQISVVLMDDGGGTLPDRDKSGSRSFNITVNDVNDAPSFNIPMDPPDVIEDAGPQSVLDFATDIIAGPPSEAGQILSFNLIRTDSDDLEFISGPSINSLTGELTYETAPDSNGTATFDVILTDDGAGTIGPDNTSTVATFTLNVTPINDAPTFSLGASPVEAFEDSGTRVIPGYAFDMSPGPEDESDQTLMFQVTVVSTTGGLVFTQAPTLDPITGNLQFESATDSTGTATVEVVLIDDGVDSPSPNENTSAVQTFEIVINPAVPAALRGRKFDDLNANGLRDAGEPYLNGWTIQLYNDLGFLVAETSTVDVDVNNDGTIDPETERGIYIFDNVAPITHTVVEVLTGDWLQSLPGTPEDPDGYTVAPAEGEEISGLDFGNFLPATVTGRKFHDINGNAVRDAGEEYMDGWVIELLDAAGNLLMSTTTTSVDMNNDGTIDPDTEVGLYEFVDLRPRTYTIRETLLPDWGASLPVGGEYSETLISGQDLVADFGNYIYATISGRKFHDHNANAVQEVGDEFLNGWTIELVDVNGVIVASTVTSDIDLDGDGTADPGSYLFENVIPGDYTIREVVSEPWAASTPAGGEQDVTIISDQDYELAFGNFQYVTISGRKFLDLNGSGALNSNEEFLNGWTIELVDDTGTVVASAVTQDRDLNSDGTIDPTVERGLYEFTNVIPGEYTVREVLVDDWVQTTPATGTYELVLASGDVVLDRDFGNYAPGTVSGRKLHDLNGNSLVDPDEPYLDGWVIELVDINGIVRNTATTTSVDLNQDGIIDPALESGWYFIEGVIPGTYTVREVLQPDWIQSAPGGSVVVSVGNGEVIEGIDFANYQNVTVEGQKFHDANGDGFWNSGETALNGFVVELVNRAGNVVRTQSTSDRDLNGDGTIDPVTERGWYSFDDVFPGEYTVREIVPLGWVQSAPLDGTFDVALTSGQAATDQNFGNFQPAIVEGRKYEDLNANGTRDAGEPWLNGWTIELVDFATGDVVATQVTRSIDLNSDGVFNSETEVGYYSFDRIVEGTYVIREATPPSGWTPSTAEYTVSLQPLEVLRDADFGNYREVVLRGRKWEDLNADGFRDSNEPYLEGWTIILTAPDGTTQTSVTDADGWYEFVGLRPGDYELREDLQEGWSGLSPVGGRLADAALLLDAQFEFYSDGTLPLASQVERRAWFRSATDNDAWYFVTQGGQLFKWDGGQIEVGGELITIEVDGETIDRLSPLYFEQPALLYNAQESGLQTISLISGVNRSDVDFVNYREATISGRKYEDANENGMYDDGEAYLEGWEIQLLTTNGILVASTTTDADGFYSFGGLLPGDYGIMEVSQAGWTQSEPAVAPLADEAFSLDQQFSFYTTGDFLEDRAGAGAKWFRSSEERTSWFYIVPEGDIYRWGGEIDSQTGDILLDGSQFIASLTPDYHADPFLLLNSEDPRILDVTLLSAASAEQDFGNYQLNGRIRGRKFHDINGNGVQESNEPGLNGWEITLTPDGGSSIVVTTASVDLNNDGQIDPMTEAGWYEFSGLDQGAYELTEEVRDGWSVVPARSISVGAGTNAVLNFGNYLPGIINGSLFHDQNANGVDDDPADTTQSGWTVSLLDLAGNVVDTTQTDASGNYTFDGIAPGTYRVQETVQDGWEQSSPGDDGFATTAQLLDETYGLFLTDNQFENWGGLEERWIRGEGGNWFFILPDGRFFQWDGVSGQGGSGLQGTELADFPSNYYDNLGLITEPVNTTVTVFSDQQVAGIDFGNYQLASITGRKWEDTNGNGELDENESYLNGWTIFLKDENGNILQTVVTSTIDGQEGTYEFTGLRPGTYLVEEEFVDGWIQTATNDEQEDTPDPGEIFGPNAALAFELDTTYDLIETPSQFLNWGGEDEKWFISRNEDAWFYILPNGELYRWDGISGRGGIALNGTLVETLDPLYHDNTLLLIEARSPAVAVQSGTELETFAFGNQEVDDAFAGLGGLLD